MRRATQPTEDMNPVSVVIPPVEGLNAEISFLSKIKENIARTIEKKREDIPFLETKEKELKQSIAELEKNENDLISHNASVTQRVKSIELSIKYLDEHKANLDKIIKEKADYLAGLEAKARIIAVIKGDIETLINTKIKLLAEVNAQDNRLVTQGNKIVANEQRIIDLNAEIKEAELKVSRIKEELENMYKDKEPLSLAVIQIEATKKELNALKNNKDVLEAELQGLNSLLLEKKKTVAELLEKEGVLVIDLEKKGKAVVMLNEILESKRGSQEIKEVIGMLQ